MNTFKLTFSFTRDQTNRPATHEKDITNLATFIGYHLLIKHCASQANKDNFMKLIIDIKRNSFGKPTEMMLYLQNIKITQKQQFHFTHEYLAILAKYTNNPSLSIEQLPSDNTVSATFPSMQIDPGNPDHHRKNEYKRDEFGNITRQLCICKWKKNDFLDHHPLTKINIHIKTSESKQYALQLTGLEHEHLESYFHILFSTNNAIAACSHILSFLSLANETVPCHRLYRAIQIIAVTAYQELKEIDDNRAQGLRHQIAQRTHRHIDKYKATLLQSLSNEQRPQFQRLISRIDTQTSQWKLAATKNSAMPS